MYGAKGKSFLPLTVFHTRLPSIPHVNVETDIAHERFGAVLDEPVFWFYFNQLNESLPIPNESVAERQQW